MYVNLYAICIYTYMITHNYMNVFVYIYIYIYTYNIYINIYLLIYIYIYTYVYIPSLYIVNLVVKRLSRRST